MLSTSRTSMKAYVYLAYIHTSWPYVTLAGPVDGIVLMTVCLLCQDSDSSVRDSLIVVVEFIFAMKDRLRNINENSYNSFTMRVGQYCACGRGRVFVYILSIVLETTVVVFSV